MGALGLLGGVDLLEAGALRRYRVRCLIGKRASKGLWLSVTPNYQADRMDPSPDTRKNTPDTGYVEKEKRYQKLHLGEYICNSFTFLLIYWQLFVAMLL